MLTTVEGEYENGELRLLERPNFRKTHVIVTFLNVQTDDSVSRKTDWSKVFAKPSRADKWLGALKDKGVDDCREVLRQRALERHGG